MTLAFEPSRYLVLFQDGTIARTDTLDERVEAALQDGLIDVIDTLSMEILDPEGEEPIPDIDELDPAVWEEPDEDEEEP